jgi:hypothetical protein
VFEMSRTHEMRDDVVLQTPDDVRVTLPVFHTEDACAGAVTGYLMKRIAYRAGAYAPGIQEAMFHDLNTTRSGYDLGRVQGWLGGTTDTFQKLGYRVYWRWTTEKSEPLAAWVRDGKGHRGVAMATTYEVLHPDQKGRKGMLHAVGLAVDRLTPRSDEELVMIDPWPGVGAPDRARVVPNLDAARRDRGFAALKLFWVGWS